MKKINPVLLLGLSVGAFAIIKGCSSKDTDPQKKQKLQIVAHEEKLLDYYSENKPGKWSDLDDKHSPEVKISKNSQEITVNVSSSFTSKTDHYVEVILLTDYSLKELQKKDFSKVDQKQAKAVFKLPVSSKGEYYVLLKCNLHDTWYKKILIN